jgi:N-carbamoyl-L-amino-acid hydrolase
MCDSGDFGQLRATVGNLGLAAGQINVIPHEATLTIDLRNPDDDHMTAAEQHLAGYVHELAVHHGVEVAWERMAKTAVVPFHPGIQQLLAATADDLGLPYVRAMSGAGHDAQEISAICPTAMVFVAGENGGISHTPREYSTPGACANGTDVLANTVLRLADQP